VSKNLIPAVAEMLGLKLREKFRIDRYDEVYFFTEENLEVNKAYPQNIPLLASPDVLEALIKGECEIIKIPWLPNRDEDYWTFGLYCDKSSKLKWIATRMTWNGEPDDYAAYKAGWVFATQDDAEKALSNVAKDAIYIKGAIKWLKDYVVVFVEKFIIPMSTKKKALW
jgi:hypothetical protein